MKKLSLLFLLLTLPAALNAQMLDHPLVVSAADVRSTPLQRQTHTDSLAVLAVMVQFQIDTDQRTTGNGRFDTSRVSGGDIPVDAPPRNAAFFSAHLTFLGNYYSKASKGKVIIQPTLIPQVITLPDVMARYSPAKNAPSTPVADLARDTWRKVDSLGLVTDFSSYDAFILFHAGVGRDIDLVSALGYDPAPLDIPSLYLGPGAFQDAHGTPGIPLTGGALIPNTIVLPETESRSIPGISGDVFLEYSINGLLCASFGNYLGLPDLFDTRTGRTAIGRFGLMDGQGIFSFSGVFPPEPSAWEKYWLGWIEPIPLSAGTTVLDLPAVALADSVYSIPIGPQEYYLLENRNRDPLRNGQRITMVHEGVSQVLTFTRDTVGFNAFDVTRLAGTVTDVEDLDWSLPGGVDQDGTFYDGGLLLWHVDERVIRRELASNTVNANPARRGVDLEEADGSQDLGQEYGFLSGGSGSEIGTALDFWYQGNSSPVYKNRFDATTFPAALSNDGAQSLVVIDNISARAPRMTARVSIGTTTITPLPGFPKQTRQPLAEHALTLGPVGPGGREGFVLVTTHDTLADARAGQPAPGSTTAKIYAWGADGSPALASGPAGGRIAATPAGSSDRWSPASIADIDLNGVPDFVWTEAGNTPRLRAVTMADGNGDGFADELFAPPVPGSPLAPPVIGPELLAVPGGQGRVHWFTPGGSLALSEVVLADSAASVAGVSRAFAPFTFVVTGTDGSVVLTSRNSPAAPPAANRSIRLGRVPTGPASVVPESRGRGGVPAFELAITTTDGMVYLLDPGLTPLPGFPVRASDNCLYPPAVADIDGDGERDIIVFVSEGIHVYNRAGVLLDRFPVSLPVADTLASPPVVGDVDGDGYPDIVGATRGGTVVAVDRSGRLLPGFPLAAGAGRQSVALARTGDSLLTCVASHDDGSLSVWLTGKAAGTSSTQHPWPQFQRDAARSSRDTVRIGGQALSAEFFPPARAYNWPNPAYGQNTKIRYFVGEDAAVTITIFDLAGDLVTTLAGPGVAGVDNEVSWDLTGVQSGVYFAHIEATGTSSSGARVVKIAVVK